MKDETGSRPPRQPSPPLIVAAAAAVYGLAARIDEQAEDRFGQRPPRGLEPIGFLVAAGIELLADRRAAA